MFNYNIESLLVSIDWYVVFKNECINNAVNIFYNLLLKMIDTNCKKKHVFISKYSVWLSSTLRYLIVNKKLFIN